MPDFEGSLHGPTSCAIEFQQGQKIVVAVLERVVVDGSVRAFDNGLVRCAIEVEGGVREMREVNVREVVLEGVDDAGEEEQIRAQEP